MDSSIEADQNGTLLTERYIPYAPSKIYDAFSDADSLSKWWGPKDFTNTFEIFDFSVGGHWKYQMHGPDGHDYPNEAIFTELLESEKVTIEHVSAPRFTLSVYLKPRENGTQITWVQKFEDPKVAEAVRHIAEPGNEQNLDRLYIHLSGEL